MLPDLDSLRQWLSCRAQQRPRGSAEGPGVGGAGCNLPRLKVGSREVAIPPRDVLQPLCPSACARREAQTLLCLGKRRPLAGQVVL